MAFIGANTRIAQTPGLPVRLHVADELTPIWEATERDLGAVNVAPPFWAFPWAGGQALARYVLDHPDIVRGRKVLDLATGSGLVAIAAALAGAGHVYANDIDPMCEAAVRLNAQLNGAHVEYLGDDFLMGAAAPAADVVLAADVFYEQTPAALFLALMQRLHGGGARVLAGDPGRTYFPRGSFRLLAEYEVATSTEIENRAWKTARVWRIADIGELPGYQDSDANDSRKLGASRA